jgi:hypothetical protein
MVGSNENHGRSRRPGVDDRGWSSTGQVLGGQTIERSADAVCGLHCTQGDQERRFLGLASKLGSTVCQWFGLKTTGMGFLIWVSKPAATVWGFEPQNHRDGFLVWASKPCRLWFVGCAAKLTGG